MGCLQTRDRVFAVEMTEIKIEPEIIRVSEPPEPVVLPVTVLPVEETDWETL